MAVFKEKDERRPEWEIPSGVYVVSLKSGERVNAYAAAWIVRVSEVPVIIQTAVWEENYSYELAQDCTHFAVHILEKGQQDVALHRPPCHSMACHRCHHQPDGGIRAGRR